MNYEDKNIEQQPMRIGKLYLISILLNPLPIIMEFFRLEGKLHGDGAIGFYIFILFFIISSIINLSFFLLNIESVRNNKIKNFFACYASSLFFLMIFALIFTGEMSRYISYSGFKIDNFIYSLGTGLLFSIHLFTNFLLVFIYRIKSKKIHAVKMLKRCLTGLIITIISLALLTLVLTVIYSPLKETVEIKQNIGGTLICNYIDHEGYYYTIDYEYKLENGHLIKMGNGMYKGKWGKDEQLVKYKDWLILKTRGVHYFDKLIIAKTNKNVQKEYIISYREIEQEKLWEDLKIKPNWGTQEPSIEEINNNGTIKIKYKFGVYQELTKSNKYDSVNIYYQIDEKTGDLTMIKIEQ